MYTILRADIDFDLFMGHLIRELSSENLLFLIEAWQYRRSFLIINDDTNNNDINTPIINNNGFTNPLLILQFPNHVPTSLVCSMEKKRRKSHLHL